MTWLVRHAWACGVVALAVGGAAVFFVVARPGYHPASTIATVKMANQHHYVLADFRPQFAAERISLRRVRVLSGIAYYTDRPAGSTDDAFLVLLYPPTATVHFDTAGPKPLYQARLGNLDVTDGGQDKAFAARVAAAVAAIKR